MSVTLCPQRISTRLKGECDLLAAHIEKVLVTGKDLLPRTVDETPSVRLPDGGTVAVSYLFPQARLVPHVVRLCASRADACVLQLWPLARSSRLPITAPVDEHAALRRLRAHVGFEEWVVAGGASVRSRVPERRPSFVGREREVALLSDWWGSKSAVAVVAGDGGFGKTALVIEFLHRLREGQISDRLPKLICFTTAKRTQYRGDVVLAVEPELESPAGILRELARMLKPGYASWFELREHQLRSFVSRTLEEEEISPADVLMVLDNAETLTEGGARTLKREVSDLVRHGFRLIITSRREGELIETGVDCRTMTVDHLELADAVDLLRSELVACSAPEVPEETLSRVAVQLNCHPLLLKVAVSRGQHDAAGLVALARSLVRDDRGTLGGFLFDDVWKRLTGELREILVAVSQRDGTRAFLQDVASQVNVPVVAIERDAELERFGTWLDYGALDWEYALTELASQYLDRMYRENDRLRARCNEILRALGREPTQRRHTVAAVRLWRQGNWVDALQAFREALRVEARRDVGVVHRFVEFAVETGAVDAHDDELESAVERLIDERGGVPGVRLLAARWAALRHGAEGVGPFLDAARMSGVEGLELGVVEAQAWLTSLERFIWQWDEPPADEKSREERDKEHDRLVTNVERHLQDAGDRLLERGTSMLHRERVRSRELYLQKAKLEQGFERAKERLRAAQVSEMGVGSV